MNQADILRNWRNRQRTPDEILQDEITRHNAEVERRRLAKKARRAAKWLGLPEKRSV